MKPADRFARLDPFEDSDPAAWAERAGRAGGPGRAGHGDHPGAIGGVAVTLVTDSPLIVRDLDLLVALDRRHALTVQVTIPTADAELARRLEVHAPAPAARLRAAARLAEEGLAVTLGVMPVMPRINESEAAFGPLLDAAAAAGVVDVLARALDLEGSARARFWPWLEEEFPRLLPLYRRLYGRRDRLTAADADRLLSTFRRFRLKLGFPRARPGRT
jgi:DNA repair photolyase